ncbi:murein biosynthesis integral membrane protein MurJ [Microtetraspora malaysiensis]|uniref:murein biosynthesis integral membrane protein MurJ n=1 Tax=Microtetraspora malaysiensis TaxID=161358 RepID=UPI000AE45E6F|nr:lipid II flippase MurJ [Microtetraspora malaysiensis]
MTRRLGAGVAGAAVLIGAISILARATGFAKQLVFARAVGTNCLSTAYVTANNVPNIVFEIVVGGALAGMVVPVLAGAAGRGNPTPGAGADEGAREEVGWISSALLTWAVVLLVPFALLTALLAGPLVGLVASTVPGCDAGQVAEMATRMLVVFAPQIPLYGVAVVLYGVLQAHRRFSAPAVAPLVSSVVVIVAYLLFVPLGGVGADLAELPRPAELALSVGTSLGVLALVVTVIGPVSRLGLRLRPTLRFPPGVAARVRGLALAGLGALVAQQAATAILIPVANRIGGGVLTAYGYAWAIYQVPYAVLAVPIATSAFPVLSSRAAGGDREGFAALSARTTRAVVLVSGLAAGALAAVAAPAAEVFLAQADSRVDIAEFARAVALFAPGLVGYGLTAHLSRVLYADGRGRQAARGLVAGWLVVIAAQIAFAAVLPAGWKLAGLALGQAVGMTAGGALLLVSVLRARGGEALRGVPKAAVAALAGGVAGWLAGAGVVRLVHGSGPWAGAGAAILAGAAAVAAGVLVAALLDREDLRAVRPRRKAAAGTEEAGTEAAGTRGDGV